MSSVRIILEFDDYHSDDTSKLIFKRKGGGWLDMTALKQRVEEVLNRVEDMMNDGDCLTIMIESTPSSDL